MTTAMSAIFFVMWFVWAIQANGVGGFLKHLFGPKGETTGVVKILMVVIFFAVGWLEVISIMFRPIALSFRLFGNVYAGESILEAMSTMRRRRIRMRLQLRADHRCVLLSHEGRHRYD